MKTYTPGYFWTKIFSLVVSLIIMAIGFYDLWFPANLVLNGEKVKAAVVRIEKTKPGYKTEEYTTTQPIPEEKNRSAAFWIFVEYSTPDGNLINTKLNIASQLKPAFGVGEKVWVAYDKKHPEIAVAFYDLRTWAVGFFVVLIGTFFGVASFLLALYARKPIVIPEDTPDQDPGKQSARVVKPD